jgi:hypothetical protein
MDLILWLMLIPIPISVIVAIWKVATRPKGMSLPSTVLRFLFIVSLGVLGFFLLFVGFALVYVSGPKAFQ